MTNPVVFALATNLGMVLDKYMLQTTSSASPFFVEDWKLPKGGVFEYSTIVGYPVGMIIFGPLSDMIGRRACMIITGILAVVGAVGSTFAWNMDALIAFRVMIGIGAGGEYPLAACHTAEGGEKTSVARNLGILYLTASVGKFFAPLVTLTMVSIWPTNPNDCPGPNCHQENNAKVWRGTFAVAAVVAVIMLCLRLVTTRDANATARRNTSSTMNLVCKYWKPLISTALCWAFYDIVEYGLGNNQVSILSNGEHSVKKSLTESMITNCFVLLGIVLGTIGVSNFPMKYCQFSGLLLLAVFNGINAAIGGSVGNSLKVVFYILQAASQGFPGITTIAIPAEIYPSQVKGACHGISAMTGKLGAIAGTDFFARLKKQANGQATIFWWVVAASVCGATITAIFTPRYTQKSLLKMEDCVAADDHDSALEVLYNHKAASLRDATNI